MLISSIRSVMENLADEVIVLEATSAEQALEQLERETNLDFICLDMGLPGLSGLELLGELRKRRVSIPVVMLSAKDEPDLVHRALKAGARGYISKTATRDELLEGFNAIIRTGHYVSPVLRRALDSYRAGIEPSISGEIRLTRRQGQILGLLATGASNRDIADSLGISESTVKGHLVTLYATLNSDNRTGCIAEARRLGLFDKS
jgi:DNA-binding NarL/FixJ family response regulator